jgi:plastocyanin
MKLKPMKPTPKFVLAMTALALAAPVRALNNCSSFSDLRGRDIVIVNEVAVNRYSPACIRISQGAFVRFNVDFVSHPTFGGLVSGGTATFDPTSPIGANTMGDSIDVFFPDIGEFPYYCDFHFLGGMMGSVLVDPILFTNGFED